MKIAIIIDSMNKAGGIERVISLMANYWVNNNYSVCLLTHSDKACFSFYPLDKRVKNIYIGALPKHTIIDYMPGMYPFRVIRKRIFQYKKVIKKEEPDIILSMMHGTENYYLSLFSCGIPIIGVNHITLDLRKGLFDRNILKKLFKQFVFKLQVHEFRKWQAIVALSKTDNEKLISLRCRSKYIPNPRTFDVSRESYSAFSRGKVIIMVGRFDYLKGQDRLIDVWRGLAPLYPEWKLHLVGDGPYLKKVNEKIESYNLSKQVIVTSTVKDIASLYKQSSIFALTSRTESFGMVILEAMANGLPCVVFDCENGPRDIIVDDENGYLVPDGNIKMFGEKLQKLINNKSLCEKFVDNSFKTLNCYSVSVIMKKWDELFESILRN